MPNLPVRLLQPESKDQKKPRPLVLGLATFAAVFIAALLVINGF